MLPPQMVAPPTPVAILFAGAPPITLGQPLLFGSNRSARTPFTFNSNGWLSVVPRNCDPGVVPALPAIFQALFKTAEGTWPLASWLALSEVNPPPLPVN